jgi:hypothetical protein
MKTLGIDFSSTDLEWIGIEGDAAGGKLLFQSKNKQPLPTSGSSDIDNLLLLKEILVAKFASEKFDRVGIVKAGKDCRPPRDKSEFIIELACHEAGVPCELVPVQTISAAEKRKIAARAGRTFLEAFNGGALIDPKYLERAAICAWCVLR